MNAKLELLQRPIRRTLRQTLHRIALANLFLLYTWYCFCCWTIFTCTVHTKLHTIWLRTHTTIYKFILCPKIYTSVVNGIRLYIDINTYNKSFLSFLFHINLCKFWCIRRDIRYFASRIGLEAIITSNIVCNFVF